MTIDVEYAGQLRLAAGVRGESVDLPAGATFAALLEAVSVRHGGCMRELVLGRAVTAAPPVVAFVSDVQVCWGDPSCLAGGDRVILLAPISGG